jgi:hypothetical protein
MSEQIEIDSSLMYVESHMLGFNYIKDRIKLYDDYYTEIDDLHLSGDTIEKFTENFYYLRDSLKEQIDQYLSKNTDSKLNYIKIDEYPYSDCDQYDCPNTLYKLKIEYYRYETEKEFIFRQTKLKEKEDKRNQEELEKAKETMMKLNPDQLKALLKDMTNE